MSSKVDRSVLNIKSAVRPKSYASSFFCKTFKRDIER